jgi:hypothetical protein
MEPIEPDYGLIQEVELLAGGEAVHVVANLTGAYRSAIDLYNKSGDKDYRDIALEAETNLRTLLTKLRIRRSEMP